MLTVSAASFYEDETLGTSSFVFAQSTPLTVLNGQIISSTIYKLESGKDFAQVAFDGLE
jgi:hypothetical protein